MLLNMLFKVVTGRLHYAFWIAVLVLPQLTHKIANGMYKLPGRHSAAVMSPR